MKKIKKFETRIVCFDFDGTITQSDNFPHINPEYNKEIKGCMWFCKNVLRSTVIVNSSRDTIYFDNIKKYLDDNKFSYDQIHLKCKPTADVYIDDKGLLQSERALSAFIESMLVDDFDVALLTGQLKSEMFENMYNVPESKDHYIEKDTNFRIAVGLTGGMDSTTMYKMLEKSGTQYLPYYIDMGQDYVADELDAVKNITGTVPKKLDLDVDIYKLDHIILGRNMLFILKMADDMAEQGFWGEIWFGNLEGESPIVGGDKSRRFFNDMNTMLVNHGYDIRIVNPLIGMNKFDQVALWKADNSIMQFKKTKTCFAGGTHQCGKCQACFRKYIAFKYHGIDLDDQYDTIDFDQHIKKYKIKMSDLLENKDYSSYSKDRMEKTLFVIKHQL